MEQIQDNSPYRRINERMHLLYSLIYFTSSVEWKNPTNRQVCQGFSEERAEGEADFACDEITKGKMRSPVYSERLKTVPLSAYFELNAELN